MSWSVTVYMSWLVTLRDVLNSNCLYKLTCNTDGMSWSELSIWVDSYHCRDVLIINCLYELTRNTVSMSWSFIIYCLCELTHVIAGMSSTLILCVSWTVVDDSQEYFNASLSLPYLAYIAKFWWIFILSWSTQGSVTLDGRVGPWMVAVGSLSQWLAYCIYCYICGW